MTELGDHLLDLFDTLFEVAGVTLTVTRGANAPATVPAIKGRLASERFGDETVYGSMSPSDFIVRQKDWRDIVGGEPQTHDSISWVDDNGETRSSQVAVDDRERHFDDVGQFGLLWRIHSVEQ